MSAEFPVFIEFFMSQHPELMTQDSHPMVSVCPRQLLGRIQTIWILNPSSYFSTRFKFWIDEHFISSLKRKVLDCAFFLLKTGQNCIRSLAMRTWPEKCFFTSSAHDV